MAEKSKLPDNFYKSRLTSISLSILLFVVSVGHGPIKSLSGVDIEGMQRPFVVVALLVGAAISTLSLWLSFYNEGRAVLRDKIAESEKMEFPQSALADLHAVKIETEQGFATIRDMLSDPTFRTAIIDGVPFTDIEGMHRLQEAALKESETSFPSKALVSWIVSRAADEGTFHPPVQLIEEESLKFISYYQKHVSEKIAEMSALNQEFSGKIQHLISENGAYSQNRVADKIDEVLEKISAHNNLIKTARGFDKVEIQHVGVTIPLVLFCLASMHAFGALGFGEFVAHRFNSQYVPSLPELIDGVFSPSKQHKS